MFVVRPSRMWKGESTVYSASLEDVTPRSKTRVETLEGFVEEAKTLSPLWGLFAQWNPGINVC